jgi:hypothetical protein
MFQLNNDEDDEDDEEDDEDDEYDRDDVDDDEWDRQNRKRLEDELTMIRGDDPTFTKLDIKSDGEYHFVPGSDWRALGGFIGRNTSLEEINIQFSQREIPSHDFVAFLRGMAVNRSVRKLSIAGWDHYNRELTNARRAEPWNILTRFFRENRAFECLEMDLRWNAEEHGELISALMGFGSLREFKLSSCVFFNETNCVDDVVDAVLTSHAGLRKLSIQGLLIGARGCAALAKSNLAELYLRTTIDGEGARTFETDIARNVTINTLDIGPTHFGTAHIGRQSSILVAILKSRVATLVLEHGNLIDSTVKSLSTALLHNTTLKSLNLSNNMKITPTGWVAFSNVLRDRNTVLETLDLRHNDIGNVGLDALANALGNNSSLKELVIWGIDGISAAGWVRFSTCLSNPTSALERLILWNNSLTNEGIAALANALANNSRLRELDLGCNNDVTIEGWRSLSTVLRSPTSVLETLGLNRHRINDDAMISFANALANNRRLRELHTNSKSITSDGWAAFTRILCNRASILSTFDSNHTLQRFFKKCHEGLYDPTLPDDLSTFLRMNRENAASQAARLKIIATHFSGGDINTQPFMDVSLSARHHMIVWMARDNVAELYRFLRATPSLLKKVV